MGVPELALKPLVHGLVVGPAGEQAGYPIEPDNNDPKNTVVVSFVVQGQVMRDQKEVTMWEKAELASMAQRWWADNQVSATISFLPTEAENIGHMLASKDGQFKGISFLALDTKAYKQMPYEAISDEDAEKFLKNIKSLPVKDLYKSGMVADGDKYCENDTCLIQF